MAPSAARAYRVASGEREMPRLLSSAWARSRVTLPALERSRGRSFSGKPSRTAAAVLSRGWGHLT